MKIRMRKSRHARKQWHRLDNAAKIFPTSSNKTDTKVFRFSCQLYEAIDTASLREAVYKAVSEFPVFRSVMKRGVFWYYLEDSHLIPEVLPEDQAPLSPLFDENVKGLLFRVSYYEKKINVEIHHVLTDGTGAILFFKTLLAYYLQQRYKIPHNEENAIVYKASANEKRDDSFDRYYDKNSSQQKSPKTKQKRAYSFKGPRLPGFQLRVIEGTMPLKDMIALSKEYGTTLTIFLTALLICSINDEMSLKDVKHPVVIKIPVNLRAYFNSLTARNFFGIIDVGYDFSRRSGKIEDVIEYVSTSFKEELTKDNLAVRMNALGALEKNVFLRSTPLAIKDFFMKLGYLINNRRYTFSLSNVGNIKMPEVYNQYIYMFDAFLSTDKQQACVCSYEDKIRISFTSPFVSTELQKNFFRRLSAMGIRVAVETNPVEEDA